MKNNIFKLLNKDSTTFLNKLRLLDGDLSSNSLYQALIRFIKETNPKQKLYDNKKILLAQQRLNNLLKTRVFTKWGNTRRENSEYREQFRKVAESLRVRSKI